MPSVSVLFDDIASAQHAAIAAGVEIVHRGTDEDWGRAMHDDVDSEQRLLAAERKHSMSSRVVRLTNRYGT